MSQAKINERKSILTVEASASSTNQFIHKPIFSGSELWLAFEGRYTNIRIFLGLDKAPIHKENNPMMVYTRLERCANGCFSAPIDRCNDPDDWMYKAFPDLRNKFEFKSPIEELDSILEKTIQYQIRPDHSIIRW